jgi:nitroreductase/NAD-dependent dihydropyrimidine dehydrogenase PreA subunit
MEKSVKNLIDQQKCTQCKLCIEVCPCNIIGLDENNEVNFIQEKEAICIKCGQCMAICRSSACYVNDLSYVNYNDMPKAGIHHKDFMDFLSTRRSTRNYSNKPVPKEVLDQVVESVSYAPFGAAPEKMHITIINNRKKIEESLQHISDFLDNIIKWMENPVASYIVKRKSGIEQFNTIRNHIYPIAKTGNYDLEKGDRISRGGPVIMIFHADKTAEAHTDNSLIYSTYAMLAAHSLGLGSCMNGIVPAAINKLPKLKELFGIPECHEARISITLGYPKYKYKRTIKRLEHKTHYIN